MDLFIRIVQVPLVRGSVGKGDGNKMHEAVQNAGWQAAAAAVVALMAVGLGLKFVRCRAWFPLAGAAVYWRPELRVPQPP